MSRVRGRKKVGARRWSRRAPSERAHGISRVLSPSPNYCAGEDHSSGTAVAGGLVRPTRDSSGAGRPSSLTWPCSGWGLPSGPCHQEPGALLPHRFTLACAAFAAIGGLFSAALSVASRRPGVTRHPALRSSDFPPAVTRRRSSLVPSPEAYHGGPAEVHTRGVDATLVRCAARSSPPSCA